MPSFIHFHPTVDLWIDYANIIRIDCRNTQFTLYCELCVLWETYIYLYILFIFWFIRSPGARRNLFSLFRSSVNRVVFEQQQNTMEEIPAALIDYFEKWICILNLEGISFTRRWFCVVVLNLSQPDIRTVIALLYQHDLRLCMEYCAASQSKLEGNWWWRTLISYES